MDQLKSPLKRYHPSQPNLEVGWLGADLEEGPQPAFFYFALSLEASLLQKPFNTPVDFKPDNARFFSFSLPFHQWGQNEEKTLEHWVEEEKKKTFYRNFSRPTCTNNYSIKALLHKNPSSWTLSWSLDCYAT